MKQEEKINKKLKWLILLLIFLMVLIMVGTHNFIRESRRANTLGSSGGVGITIDSNATDYKLSHGDDSAEQDVVISGIGNITIHANEKETEVDFYNPKQNAELYYLTFQLGIYDDIKQQYEILYTSGLVSPGRHIYRITLLHGLQKGVYDAMVHIQPYRMNQEKTPTNNADIKTTLIVK